MFPLQQVVIPSHKATDVSFSKKQRKVAARDMNSLEVLKFGWQNYVQSPKIYMAFIVGYLHSL